jgi:5-methylcytosine-specific restriction endonuclease McrA
MALTNRQRRLAKATEFAASVGRSKVRSPRTPKNKTNWSEHYRRKKENGICLHCPLPATVGTLCLNDWFRNVASIHFGTRSMGPPLANLWDEQKGRCFYTGVELVPGVNASLDHIVPLTKGGILSIENCRWVTKSINMVKSNLTHDEFVQLCASITARFTKG